MNDRDEGRRAISPDQPQAERISTHGGALRRPGVEWTTVDVHTVGGAGVSMATGGVVSALRNGRVKLADGRTQPLVSGRIQIQPESAEAFYRRMTLTPITIIPEKVRRAAGLDAR